MQSTNTGALDRNEPLLLWVCPGLWRSVAGYLHRNHLQCAIAIARDDENAHKRQNFYLFRCSLPTRIERLFANMPGVEAYRFITDNVAVQLGYKHPIELRSCSRVFESNRFFLFSGDRNQLTTFPWPASFVNAESIIQMHPSQSTIFELTETPGGPTPLTVDLNLIPSPTLHRKCSASCIPLSQAPWLKKLVYLLPPSVLDSHRICSTKEGIFLYREAETELIPLGEMYYRAAQGIYVSLGYEIHPQFHPAVLERHLQTKDEKLVFFTTRSPRPIQIPKHSFKPLAHELLSHIPLQTLQSETSPEQRPTPPSAIVNEPLAIFPLWGFRSKNKTDKED